MQAYAVRRVPRSLLYALAANTLLLVAAVASTALRLSKPPLFLIYLLSLVEAALATLVVHYSPRPVEERALYYAIMAGAATLLLYPFIKRAALAILLLVAILIAAYLAAHPRTPRVERIRSPSKW